MPPGTLLFWPQNNFSWPWGRGCWIPTPWPPPLICQRLLQGFEGQARHFMYGQCKSAKWTQIRTCYEGYMRRERHPGSNVNFQ